MQYKILMYRTIYITSACDIVSDTIRSEIKSVVFHANSRTEAIECAIESYPGWYIQDCKKIGGTKMQYKHKYHAVYIQVNQNERSVDFWAENKGHAVDLLLRRYGPGIKIVSLTRLM